MFTDLIKQSDDFLFTKLKISFDRLKSQARECFMCQCSVGDGSHLCSIFLRNRLIARQPIGWLLVHILRVPDSVRAEKSCTLDTVRNARAANLKLLGIEDKFPTKNNHLPG